MEEKITIPVSEYRELLEVDVRVKVFKEFVNGEKYSIDRDICGLYLGFDVDNKQED